MCLYTSNRKVMNPIIVALDTWTDMNVCHLAYEQCTYEFGV